MEHHNCMTDFRDINNPPFPEHMNPDLPHAGTDNGHRAPVAWIEAGLNGVKLKTGRTASFFRETAKILKARSDELNRLKSHTCII